MIEISNGGTHTCRIDNKDILCAGQNPFGQTTIAVLANVLQVSAGLLDNDCVLTDDYNNYQVSDWGTDDKGMLDVPELASL
ncbi:MAG: hypothetical protein OSB45_06445 [Pseudomonadales bacterium]|nr:hypothetical protein [Pseudomonadales bacterium]